MCTQHSRHIHASLTPLEFKTRSSIILDPDVCLFLGGFFLGVVLLCETTFIQRRRCGFHPMQEMWVSSLGREDPLEEEMATHSSVLAWRIPWMEEPGGLQFVGSQIVGQDLVNKQRDVLQLVSFQTDLLRRWISTTLYVKGKKWGVPFLSLCGKLIKRQHPKRTPVH